VIVYNPGYVYSGRNFGKRHWDRRKPTERNGFGRRNTLVDHEQISKRDNQTRIVRRTEHASSDKAMKPVNSEISRKFQRRSQRNSSDFQNKLIDVQRENLQRRSEVVRLELSKHRSEDRRKNESSTLTQINKKENTVKHRLSENEIKLIQNYRRNSETKKERESHYSKPARRTARSVGVAQKKSVENQREKYSTKTNSGYSHRQTVRTTSGSTVYGSNHRSSYSKSYQNRKSSSNQKSQTARSRSGNYRKSQPKKQVSTKSLYGSSKSTRKQASYSRSTNTSRASGRSHLSPQVKKSRSTQKNTSSTSQNRSSSSKSSKRARRR